MLIQEPNLWEQVKNTWGRITFCPRYVVGCEDKARFVIVVSTILYLLGWTFEHLPSALINYPCATIYEFEVWRIFTSPFAMINAVSLAAQLFLYVPYAILQEKQIGTIRYLCFFFASNLILQLFYTFAILLLSLFYTPAKQAYTYGLLPFILTEAYLAAWKNPEKFSPLFLVGGRMKEKYHPWVLLVLFAPLFQIQGFLLLAGLFLGHLCAEKMLDDYYNFSTEKATNYESSWLFIGIRPLAGFVSVEAAQGYVFEMEEQTRIDGEVNDGIHSVQIQMQEMNLQEKSHEGTKDKLTAESSNTESKKEDNSNVLNIPDYDLVDLGQDEENDKKNIIKAEVNSDE